MTSWTSAALTGHLRCRQRAEETRGATVSAALWLAFSLTSKKAGWMETLTLQFSVKPITSREALFRDAGISFHFSTRKGHQSLPPLARQKLCQQPGEALIKLLCTRQGSASSRNKNGL
ncbi:Retinoic Acid Receptor Rxr-Beta [Manis pentadactyla]|nr:Retinoic Acid Receptor Rxr-Beta [Manis pentadactyla]